MKILSIECKNFKAFESVNYQFGDRIVITGDNFQGKTSIAEAIVFGLFGTNLTGSPYTDGLIRKGTKSAEVTVMFEVGEETHEVTRVKGKKSEVYLDGEKLSQTEVDKFVGEKERFLTVFLPGYFTGLPDKDGREMLMKLIRPPVVDEVLRAMGSTGDIIKGEVLRDPEGLAKEKRAEIKATEAELQKITGQLEVLQERANRTIPEPMKFDEIHLDELKQKLSDHTSTVKSELQRLKQQSQGLRPQYDMLKRQIQAVPAAPYAEGDTCPVCAQTMAGEALEHALKHHHQEAARIQQKNAELTQQGKALIAQGEEIKRQIEALETQIIEESSTEALRSEIAELERQRAEVFAHNAQVSRMRIEIAEDNDTIQKQRTYMEQLEADKFKMSEQVKALTEYRAKYAEIQVSQLKQYLNRVDIQLFEVAKTTGELKPTFTILYDGKEFKTLSYSERIRVNLEFSTLFNKVLGHDWPVYIDNAESITHFDEPAASQLFMASVVKGQELQVKSNEVVQDVKGDVA